MRELQSVRGLRMEIPTLESLKALNGRVLAMLSPDETAVLQFYRSRGRKFDVTIEIIGGGSEYHADGAQPHSLDQLNQLQRRTNSRVNVIVGEGAEQAWAERASRL